MDENARYGTLYSSNIRRSRTNNAAVRKGMMRQSEELYLGNSFLPPRQRHTHVETIDEKSLYLGRCSCHDLLHKHRLQRYVDPPGTWIDTCYYRHGSR